jgi:hypothetical protein
MAISDFRYPVNDPDAQARALGNIRTQFAERTRTHGLESAKAQLAKVGIEPSLADVREAEQAAAAVGYRQLRATNPAAAALAAKNNPSLYASAPATTTEALREAQHLPPDAPSALSAADSFAQSRARASTTPLTSGEEAWAHATKQMVQNGGRK